MKAARVVYPAFFLFLAFLWTAPPATGLDLCEHPRLYLNPENRNRTPGLEKLRRRITDPAYSDLWQRVIISTSPADMALEVLLTGDTTGLPQVREALGKVTSSYRPLCLLSLAYDWAYRALSPDERKLYAGKLMESVEALEKRYPMSVVYHNMSRGRNMATGLAMLAAWDDDPRARELFPRVREELQDFLDITGDGVPLPDMAGRASYGGGWAEGYDYDRHGSFFALQLLLGWRSAGLDDHISGSSHWRDKIYSLLYGTFPDGKWVLPYEDNDHPQNLSRQDREVMTFLAREFGSPHARWWIAARGEQGHRCRPYWEFLFHDPSVKPREPGDLPTSRLIRGLDLALMRSSWNEDATFVHFHCGSFFTYHQQAAQGSFSIYRNTPLIVEPGVYDNEVNPHFVNWRIRTISHNCITVLDPQERFLGPREVSEPANDGGQKIQRWSLKPGTYLEWRDQRRMRETGKITSWLTDSSHDLAVGEAARAYAPHKVKRWCRQLMFVKPDWVVLCDLVVSGRPDYEKTLTLHCPEDFRLEGEVVSRTGGAPLAIYCLLPEKADLIKAGGPGKAFIYGGNDWMGGDNQEQSNRWTLTGGSFSDQFKNAWRLEVKAPQADTTVFLTALYLPGSGGGKSLPEVRLAESPAGTVALRLDSGKYSLAFDPCAEKPYKIEGPGITYSISGTLTDRNGMPVEGAPIRLAGVSSRTALTDNHGLYLFQGLEPGEYTVALQSIGGKKAVRITLNSVGEVNFEIF
ncbi:MAG: carboxypeptidase regulatory-like domain-containing protein [Gemmatimonadota bacterium]|nr:carboxypeptidase regulatory-like domain-containing protein [Gemmatimonadota bacterium]